MSAFDYRELIVFAVSITEQFSYSAFQARAENVLLSAYIRGANGRAEGDGSAVMAGALAVARNRSHDDWPRVSGGFTGCDPFREELLELAHTPDRESMLPV